jgi:predicted Zn-dependent protease
VVKMAEARWRAGQPDAARSLLEKLLEKDPGNLAARNLLKRVRRRERRDVHH